MPKKKPRKHPVTVGGMHVRAYPVLAEAVERGVQAGWERAHRHPAVDGTVIRESIEQDVISAVCEAFDFDGEVRP